ncbi:hypothetical protein KUTeg_003268 [Tegillarca granosa]|uniref:Uncharacterized protein n=1 Tax=Tegillarca granosa TaxID=220873 RepID=A0ABQ9FQJ0_TEGGR|nr:hypothetical protein KUTeg_003268 [Tegillarca granosa]
MAGTASIPERINNNVLMKSKEIVDPHRIPGPETGVVSTISGNNSHITRQFPDIVDIDRVVLNSSQLNNRLNDIARMRERNSSSTSSGNVQQSGDRRMSSSPPQNDTTRNNLEQSVTTPIDQSRRSESPAIDYRSIDNRTRSSPTQSATNTDLSSPRPIQTQDLNAGVCCVVTGIVLAALHAAGNSYLFLAIMFIGLGVLLVVVVAVGWKCTPRGHEPLHALFSLGDFRRQRGTRRQHRQHGGHRSREGHWYGGVLYPEFQYRRPPPSYNASMQDYQTQLALAQSHREFYNDEDLPAEDYSLPSSPPPSYRSRASTVRTGIPITFPNGDQYPNSRPPTYRSHISTSRSQAHPRPSLPRGESGEIEGQGGDIAFNGPESVSNTHSRNNSVTVNNVNPGAVTINISNNGNTSTPLDVERVQQILHSRQPSGSAINSAQLENSTTEGLDQDIQQTLQTLDNATSSVMAESSTNYMEGSENATQNPEPNDDDYPMLTSL